VQPHFFGADEVITNYAPGRENWVATLIVCEDSRDAAWEKRNRVITDIRQYFKIDGFRDSSPKSIKNKSKLY
jgi:pyrrolysine biosynthesis protein PylC